MRRKLHHDVCAAVVSDLLYDARVWKEVRSLAAVGYNVRLLGCRFDVAQISRRREGRIDVLEIPFGSRSAKKSAVRRFGAVLRLWLGILRTRARVYHAHNVHVGPPAWLSSRLRRATLIYDAHEIYGRGSNAPDLRGRVLARTGAAAERFMVRHSDVVFTTNESRANVLKERYGVPRVEVLANVPSRTETVVPLDPGYPAGRRILLYQGWISPHGRAFRETVQALALLDDVDFVILGFGYESSRDVIRGWATDEHVQDRVHFLPPRRFDELVQTAAAATVGLVPIKALNLNSYLGDTNKIHEYLMAGLPIAASDLPEIRRVANDGDPPVGELFEPSLPRSIAAAVRRILDDPVKYQARKREARRLALERFNWQIEERCLLDVYEGIAPRVPMRDRLRGATSS